MTTPPSLGPSSGSDPLMEALAAAISRYRVRRVPLPELRRVFAHHDPTGATSNDSRTRLADALEALRSRGAIVVPQSRNLYESHLSPPLPQWVERPPAPRAPRQATPVRVWRPELSDAAALVVTNSDYDTVARVDAFLRDEGSSRPLVPHRERSVELFGNEKRLDRLLRSKMFTTGALTLDLLRCYVAPLPLTAQHTGNPGPDPQLLVVENHATYESVLRLAREHATPGAPALAVGYGSGNQFPHAIGGITQLNPVPTRLWYFGDLDEDGVAIAVAAAAAAEASGLPTLRPALPLYRTLLDTGAVQQGNRIVDHDRAGQLTAWFDNGSTGHDIAFQVTDLLTAGKRLAQESVGYELMLKMGGPATWLLGE
jgi:hypothetical protein